MEHCLKLYAKNWRENTMIKYNDIKIEGKTKISPSSFVESMISPSTWYKSQILKEGGFKGNTASVLGTLVHAKIEAYYNDSVLPESDISAYLSQYVDNPDVDEWSIRDNLEGSYKAWVKDYGTKYPKPDELEKALVFEPSGIDYYIAGSCDARQGNIVIDWKTSATKKTSIGNYRYQLLIYAWVYKQLGVKIDTMRICYIIHKTKTLQARIEVVDEPINDSDYEYIEGQLKLLIKKCKYTIDHPEALEFIWNHNPDTYYGK